jgi:hypothetical protein
MESKMSRWITNGHLSDEASAVAADALLHQREPELPDMALQHVDECAECKGKIFDVANFLTNPGSEVPEKQVLPITVKPFSRKDWYFGKIAAIFVVFAVLLSIYVFLEKNPSLLKDYHEKSLNKKDNITIGEKNTVGKNNGTSTSIPHHSVDEGTTKIEYRKSALYEQLQSQYSVNPNLENMIGSKLRSGVFEVVKPINNRVVKCPIQFSWQTELVVPHTFKLVTNKNRLVLEQTVMGKSFTFSDSLVRGLYYWKIECENELLYVGKFLIGKAPK